MRAAVVIAVALLLVGTLIAGALLIRRSSRAFDPHLQFVQFEILSSKKISDGACYAGGSLTLRSGPYVQPLNSDLIVRPICYHLVGWGAGATECLVEYPAIEPIGYVARSVPSRVASLYYRTTGIAGIWTLTTDQTPNIFLMLDYRWCEWFGAANGLSLIGKDSRTPGASN